MKVVFALASRYPYDERVFFQQAQSLRAKGCETFFVSSIIEKCDLDNTRCFDSMGMSKKSMVSKMSELLMEVDADVIICDNPMSVFAAKKCCDSSRKPRIYYDVTEWYPSKKNLRNISLPVKFVKLIALPLLSVYAACIVDGFIFGEYYKKRPFRLLFPWKKYVDLSYYSSVEAIKVYPSRDISKECRLFYSGWLTKEKGFFRVVDVARQCSIENPEIKFTLNVIAAGNGNNSMDLGIVPDNLEINITSALPFPKFCDAIGNSDIYFDLRNVDFENTRCLPIKLFYYMACGRPVIYSDLKSIKKEVKDFDSFGNLVDPDDSETIVSLIMRYVSDAECYRQKCVMARQLSEQKYNWKNIEKQFVDFICE